MKTSEARVWRWHKERLRERATVRLTEAEKDALDELAIRTGRTVSDLLRQAASEAGLIGEIG